MWLFWLLVSVVCTSAECATNRRILRNSTDTGSYLVNYNLAATLLLVAVMPFGTLRLPQAGMSWVLLLVAGATWYLGARFSFQADRRIEVSVSSLISQIKILLLVILGAAIFKESLTPLQLGGVGLMFSGLVVLNIVARRANAAFAHTSDIHARRNLWIGVGLKLLSVSMTTTAIMIDKTLTNVTDPAVIAVSGYLLPLVLGGIASLRKRREADQPRMRFSAGALVAGCLSGTAYVTLVQSFSAKPLSLVFSLYQMNVLLTLALGFFWLEERDNVWGKALAGIVITMGSVALVW